MVCMLILDNNHSLIPHQQDKALNSQNLPDPTILKPNKHFAAFTYTGTGSSGDVVNITNSDVDFTPDWVWVKTRDVTNDHILSDSEEVELNIWLVVKLMLNKQIHKKLELL